MPISFSIIIPTFHRPNLLRQTLSTLLTLDYPLSAYEIVVVSNDPEDRATDRVVKRLQKRARNLKYCTERQRGASPARNRGVQVAAYRHLIFLDDDIRVSPLFLQGYQKAWRTYPEARVIGGKLIATPANEVPLTHTQQTLVEKHDWCFGQLNRGDENQLLTRGELLYSGNLSYRREQKQTTIFHPALGRYAAGIGRVGV